MSRYIDIEPYEKDGWYLQKTYYSTYGAGVKTAPLISVPTASDFYDDNGHLLNNPISETESIKHGKWNTVVNSNNHITYYCPICGSIFNKGCADLGDYNYCPNCGAKMDLDEVENG